MLTALPVEPWVRDAAEQFNAGDHVVDGVPIEVEIVAADGLTALGRWDRNEYGALPAGTCAGRAVHRGTDMPLEDFPTAWIPDSRYLVELANASYKERLGRDVFLTDGEYRARPIAISLFAWGLYDSRGDVLEEQFGDINWSTIHDAAIAKGGWPELGGDPAWGFFKLVVPNPSKNVGGLAAMIAMAGEYYDRTDIGVEDVTDPEFQAWLSELMGAVTDFSSASAYTAEDFALFGYSVGDGGQLLESDLLQNMQGILTRWEDPLQIYYPDYRDLVRLPIHGLGGAGDQRAAEERCAGVPALPAQPGTTGSGAGLRATPGQPQRRRRRSEDSLFVKWQEQGVQDVVPRT